ncbi:MAG: hypothetical protein ACOX4U_08780 [Anaerovoracaceae bacterium]|jgi:hypothetical protein|nr:hypothetical protein [Tissierellia bacterium]
MVTINITPKMKNLAYEFSTDIIMQNNQYDRMRPTNIHNINERNTIRINRTYVGKLAELCFNEYLLANNIFLNIDDMFVIFEGQENVDDFDFYLPNSKTIDVKAAVFNNHRNLVVPIDQYENTPKNFYVGVKFNCPIKNNDYRLIYKDTFSTANIVGFCTYEELKNKKTINLGEFDCKAILLNELTNIKMLIDMFK